MKSVIQSDINNWIQLEPQLANVLSYTDSSLIAPGVLDFGEYWRGVKV